MALFCLLEGCSPRQRQRTIHSHLTHRRTSRCHLLAAILVAFLLLLESHEILHVRAAVTTAGGPLRRNPSLASHMGDIVPLTLYMRLKRQIRWSYLGTAGADPLEVEGGPNLDDGAGGVGGAKKFTTLPEQLQPNDLNMPSFGATTGMHQHQAVRLFPPVYSPRFGINKAVSLSAGSSMRAAGASLEKDSALQQSDLAFRFSVGRGLQKESTWLPLAVRKTYQHRLLRVLTGHLDGLQAAEADTQRRRDEEAAEGLKGTAAEKAAQQVQYLSRVTFFFGYQRGDLQKVTSFAISAQYSTKETSELELRYVWSEHRPYNAHRATTICSAVALAVSMIATVAVFHPASRSRLLFSQRMVAVHARD